MTMNPTNPTPNPIPLMSRFRVRFHDYVHGRISIHRVVEAPSIMQAEVLARDGIVMPSYIIAAYVAELEGPGRLSPDPLPWSSFPPGGNPPEPPMLRMSLSDPEIRALAMPSPEEVYGEMIPHDHDGPVTMDEIVTAINRYPHLMTDAGSVREDIGRCPELADLLLSPAVLNEYRDTRPLQTIVAHLADLTGETTQEIYRTLRADARTARESTPLSTGQDRATLEGVETEEDHEDH